MHQRRERRRRRSSRPRAAARAAARRRAPGNAITESVWPAKRLAAQDHEPADDAGHDGDDRPRLERVDHERVGGQLVEVGDRARATSRRDGDRASRCAWRSVWWAGASGRPTTTSRPSEVSQHFDRNAVEAAERLGRDDLARRAHDRPPRAEVDDAVEVGEQRVDVVRDQQHRHPLLAADRAPAARPPRSGWGGRGCPAARRGSAAAGRLTSAWAISSRCCSPPDSSPIGRVA